MRAIGLVVFAGCTFAQTARDRDASAIEAGAGASVDSLDVCGGLSFTPSNTTCDLPATGAPIVIDAGSKAILDTGARTLMIDGNAVAISSALVAQPAGPELLVVVAQSVAVGGTLSVTGSRPVAIVAGTRIDVTGMIDAGAAASVAGPGANPAACGTRPNGVTQTASNADSGGTGGGGGGYRTAGGIGARVPTGGNDVAGGAMNGTVELVPLRGGCSGGDGGFGNALGGGGGGGLQLVANVAIEVAATGIVRAAGGGGTGTSIGGGGGGGGGSGGSILLEAPELVIAGKVTAHGGAGGEGSRRTTGFTGGGEDGHANDATAAVCMSISASGGVGGAGGIGAAPGPGLEGTNDATDAAGGGGGGGAAGRIVLGVAPAPAITGLVSPL